MSWQTDDADVVSQMFAAKLCSKSNPMGLNEELLLKINIAESTPCLITGSGQVVVILNRSELHREQILLCRGASDDESDVVWRTSSGAQCLHLLHKERQQCAFILNGSLCHWIEVGFVCRATTLCHHHKAILHAVCCLDVNLCRKVTASVYLVIHIQRRILRIAQVVFSVCIIYSTRESLLVVEACPYLLALLAVDDSRARILTERQHTFHRCLGIAEELQGHIFVIL